MPAASPVLIIAGPTASGKSALALRVAEAFDGTVINADSMQVYRELRILTARPSPEEEARVPHRLYGCLSVTERCSAGRWMAMATEEIRAAWSQSRLPIVAGGTGLYLKALTHGLASVPNIPERAVEDARALHGRLGGEAFRARLAELDPESTARLAAGDTQRLIRAYSVAAATGRPIGAWQRDRGRRGGAGGRWGETLDAEFVTVALMPPASALYAVTDARFDRMMAAGALAEADAIERLGLDPTLPAARALGVRELRGHLTGALSLDEASAAAKRATRNFVKRQLTWLRHQMKPDRVIPRLYTDAMWPEVLVFLRESLLTERG